MRNDPPLLVTGGTGTLGSLVVARLREAGRPVRVLSRTPGAAPEGVERVVAQLESGEGVAAAVAGVETVIHCAGSARGDDLKARSLVTAARAAGVRHIVYISVVGADRVHVRTRVDRAMFGYYEQKLAGERIIAESGVPWSTLRATQFHSLILLVADKLAGLPVVPLPPRMRVQPVDADDVAARLVELALDGPSGLVPDIAGPETWDVGDLVRDYLRRLGKRRPILRVALPGAAAKEVLAGANLAPDRGVGTLGWSAFLDRREAAGQLSR